MMIPNQPYLIRAMFDWIVDNDWTPHLQVDANYPGIEVPMEFVQDGMIVLNVHPDAVRELQMGNDWIHFKARFQGVERRLGFPPQAVRAIFARENGQGMPFMPEPYPDTADEETPSSSGLSAVPSSEKADGPEPSSPGTAPKTKDRKTAKKGAHLSVVK